MNDSVVGEIHPHRKALYRQLDQERFWLEEQSGMEDWPAGCLKIATHLEELIAEFAGECCEEYDDIHHPDYPVMLKILWARWAHAWYYQFTRRRTTYDRAEVLRLSRKHGMAWEWTPYFRQLLWVVAYHHYRKNDAFSRIDHECSPDLIASLRFLQKQHGRLIREYGNPLKKTTWDQIDSGKFVYGFYAKLTEKGTWKNYAGIGTLSDWLKYYLGRLLKNEDISDSKTVLLGDLASKESESREAGGLTDRIEDTRNSLGPEQFALLKELVQIRLEVIQEMPSNWAEFLANYSTLYGQGVFVETKMAEILGLPRTTFHNLKENASNCFARKFIAKLTDPGRPTGVEYPEQCRAIFREFALKGEFYR